MPTLTETLTALNAVQQLDTRIQRAKRSQSTLDNGTAATAQSESARALAESKRTELHHRSGELKDTELKVATLETKRKSYQQKLYQGTVTHAKELANIEKEIDSLGRQISDFEGRILELMEQTEQAQANAAGAEAQAVAAEGHRADTVSAFRARYEELNLEITDLTRQRQEAVLGVEDKALLKRYDDIRAKAAGVGIARLDGNACGGCHMTLPSMLVKAVKECVQAQVCDNCGRLMLP